MMQDIGFLPIDGPCLKFLRKITSPVIPEFILARDKVAPQQEIQCLNLAPYSAHAVSHITDKCNPEKLPIHAIELYARYASKERGLEKPIFSYEDYKRKGISFSAFLDICKGTLRGVVFYDNVESSDKSLQLRFEWWHPKFRDKVVQCDAIVFLNADIDRSLGKNDSRKPAKQEIHVVPFQKSPILSGYDTPLFEYNWKANIPFLIKSVTPQHVSALEEIFRQAFSKTAPELQQSVNCLSLLPWWDVVPEFEIQLPVLDEKFLEKMNPVIVDGMNPNYCCYHEYAEGESNAIAFQYAHYLKDEMGCDNSPYYYQGKNDIYFIMSKEAEMCVGIFIFKSYDRSKYFEETKEQYLTYCETHEKAVLAEKIKKHEGLEPRRDRTGGVFSRKLAQYMQFNFYEKTHQKEGVCYAKFPRLCAAWIHPFHRNRGIFSRLWPYFKKRYPAFEVDAPSTAMQAFIERREQERCTLRGTTFIQ